MPIFVTSYDIFRNFSLISSLLLLTEIISGVVKSVKKDGEWKVHKLKSDAVIFKLLI